MRAANLSRSRIPRMANSTVRYRLSFEEIPSSDAQEVLASDDKEAPKQLGKASFPLSASARAIAEDKIKKRKEKMHKIVGRGKVIQASGTYSSPFLITPCCLSLILKRTGCRHLAGALTLRSLSLFIIPTHHSSSSSILIVGTYHRYISSLLIIIPPCHHPSLSSSLLIIPHRQCSSPILIIDAYHPYS